MATVRVKVKVWCILNPTRRRLECLRCGRHHALAQNLELWAMTALSEAFLKQHRPCKERSEGLHCHYCLMLGHKPEFCPELNAKSPEAWLDGPDTGLSPLTIYGVLYDEMPARARQAPFSAGQHPLDPADFGRCHRLLKLFPTWAGRLHEVAEKHSRWAPLVAAWGELAALYEEEHPSGRAPKLYERMKVLLGEVG